MKQKRSLGQVFVKDKNIIDKILKYADVSDADHVLEVGCGEGWLSRALALSASSLTIIEIDQFFLDETQTRLGDLDNVSYHLSDVLKLDWELLAKPRYKIVANIPYYISAKFMQLLASKRGRFSTAFIMVQKEFADKLLAREGTKSYTSLAVFCRFYFDISWCFDVSKNSFRPIPNVDSTVIEIRPKETLPLQSDNILFHDMVRSAFWARRKTLLNCLQNAPYLKTDSDIKNAPFFLKNPSIRGEVLDLKAFLGLFNEIKLFIESSGREI